MFGHNAEPLSSITPLQIFGYVGHGASIVFVAAATGVLASLVLAGAPPVALPRPRPTLVMVMTKIAPAQFPALTRRQKADANLVAERSARAQRWSCPTTPR